MRHRNNATEPQALEEDDLHNVTGGDAVDDYRRKKNEQYYAWKHEVELCQEYIDAGQLETWRYLGRDGLRCTNCFNAFTDGQAAINHLLKGCKSIGVHL
ncbi:MAG: hypothetical protein LBJ95_01000 [Oscillospiraceae bacterium]|nr:hypothetical protein [Oscillospiraceae bacterium]